jgi:two-component system, OmpR family, response regulator BaeR
MKPFSPRELLARVNAQIRRSEGRMTQTQARTNLIIDHGGQRISWHGQWLELSPSEFCLLCVLSKSPGRIYSRAQLLDHLGDHTIETGERAIDSHVKNIRRKLCAINAGGGGIVAVYGAGYKFDPD